MKLKFTDGKFKILILADIHGAQKEMKWTVAHIEAALKRTKPDFVVLLGDNITGRYPGMTQEKIIKVINIIGSIFEEKNIPFTFVFGNHDHEGLCELGYDEKSAKKFIMNEFRKFSCCFAEEGEEMTGVGNHNITLLDSEGEKTVFNLWFMDSNPYAEEHEGGGYGYVHRDQLEWYEKKSEELKKENDGKTVPSFVFQHIIVPQIYEMLIPHNKRVKGSVKGHGSYSNKYYTADPCFITDGKVKEGPCPPDVKSAQFNSWLRAGDILAAFFGHDHINDFSGEYKGIRLCQVPSAGFYSYGNNQGSRIITVFENNLKGYKTEVIHCKDICDVKLQNPIIKKHGYHQWLTKFLPALSVTAVVTAILLILLLLAI